MTTVIAIRNGSRLTATAINKSVIHMRGDGLSSFA
jgi:hypothetical protein